jgi:hypothetical protein
MRSSIVDATVKSRQKTKAATAKASNERPKKGAPTDAPSSPEPQATPKSKPLPDKSFAKASNIRNIRDVVDAPPELTALPRAAKKHGIAKRQDAPISLVQKAKMEAEREDAIKRYRAMKEKERDAA